jgi:hypothetical protein
MIEKGMMVTSRGNLKERIPGKALIRLNRQANEWSHLIRSLPL